MASTHMCLLGLLSLSFFIACLTTDNNNLQDFCAPCKDPKLVQADDFYFIGLDKPANCSNPMGSKVTPVYVPQIPGLNSHGVSMVRIDYLPNGHGLYPPTHPRASELMTVLEGTLEVGFISTNPEYRHFTNILNKGGAFVFPMGLLHYQRNVGNCNAVAFAALNAQNPGTSSEALALFTSKPAVNDDILSNGSCSLAFNV